jgi:hypothetical protein
MMSEQSITSLVKDFGPTIAEARADAIERIIRRIMPLVRDGHQVDVMDLLTAFFNTRYADGLTDAYHVALACHLARPDDPSLKIVSDALLDLTRREANIKRQMDN